MIPAISHVQRYSSQDVTSKERPTPNVVSSVPVVATDDPRDERPPLGPLVGGGQQLPEPFDGRVELLGDFEASPLGRPTELRRDHAGLLGARHQNSDARAQI